MSWLNVTCGVFECKSLFRSSSLFFLSLFRRFFFFFRDPLCCWCDSMKLMPITAKKKNLLFFFFVTLCFFVCFSWAGTGKTTEGECCLFFFFCLLHSCFALRTLQEIQEKEHASAITTRKGTRNSFARVRFDESMEKKSNDQKKKKRMESKAAAFYFSLAIEKCRLTFFYCCFSLTEEVYEAQSTKLYQ